MIAVHSDWIGTCAIQMVSEPAKGRPTIHCQTEARLGAAKRIGFAAGKHRCHPRPEELGGERCHEGRDADPGDEEAVQQSDDQSGGKGRKHGKPAEIVFLEQDCEDESREGDDRGKGEIDLAGPNYEGEPDREKDKRRKRREKGRIDEGLQENLRRRVHE